MWMADNLARGAAHEDLLEQLQAEGVGPGLARRALESILAAPRVFRGVALAWGDLSAWAPGALAERHGDSEVQVTVERDRQPDYEHNFARQTRVMPLRELCSRMGNGAADAIYAVARSSLLDLTPLRGYLERHLRVPTEVAASGPWTSSLWMGPAGSTTVFHHDAVDLLAVQLHGQKRWRTIAPTDRAWLDVTRERWATPYTTRDPAEDGPDRAEVREFDVREGDAILVPASTWHHVVAQTASVTLSLTELAPLPVVREHLEG